MLIKIFFLVISLLLIYHQSANGFGLEKKKRGMSYQEQLTLLKLQNKILEKEMELKEKDYKILLRKTKAEIMDKFDTALKSLTTDVRSNTKDIRRSLKMNEKLSIGLNTVDNRLKDVSRKVQSNKVLLGVLNRDKCRSGSFGLYGWPRQPSWPGTRIIIFNPPFSRTPSIVHGVTILDSNSGKNLRINVSTNNISRFGFTLKLSTWADTVLYGLTVRWMACR